MVQDPLRAIIFGDAGIGKTTFLGSGIGDKRLDPVLVVDIDGGQKAIRSRLSEPSTFEDLLDGKPALKPGKARVIRVKTWKEIDDVIAFLNDPKEKNNVYNAVYWDSLTELNYLNLRQVVEDGRRGSNRNPFTPELQDYGTSANMLRHFVRVLTDLPIHTFFTTHADLVQDEKTGKMEIRPDLVGKLSAEIPALVDIVGFLTRERVGQDLKRVMLFQPDGKVKAKARDEEGRLGEDMVDPTLPKVLDLLGM